MIICVCNRIKEDEVRAAIAKGAQRGEDVHAACGTEVSCGCCLEMIDNMADTAKAMAAAPRLQAAG